MSLPEKLKRCFIMSFRFFSICILLSLFFFVISSCSGEEDTPTLFEELPPGKTNIDFENNLSFNPDFNIYHYRNFYNGGGVALGDINNDGLLDIFFTANMGDNTLYLNRGDMQFEDVSAKAGIAGSRAWSTGVSMADVNGDGLIDIYVTNSGIVEGDDRKNELYINNGDTTFTEKAEEYGIADSGLSIHGTFFDYDKDGDLDLFVINNSYRAIGSFDLEQTDRTIYNEEGGDKLFRNDGGTFIEVSEQAGIYSSEIGFALGASVGDVNRDGWPDIYVSNDFFERDYLYINNRDGTFKESLKDQVKSISAASMGADIADLNGDGYPEIFVTDMLPEPESRLKLNTTFDDWEGYREHVNNDFYHQFTRNTLQLNNGDSTFSEVGRWAGVEATDWSWGANIADFDLDGRKDIFVANGIYQDLTNLDYISDISRGDMVKKIVTGNDVDFEKLIDMIPSNPVPNYIFHNKGNMQFADSSSSWGIETPGFSSGSAYGDLDNDGDLDLVINNVESKAFVYENTAEKIRPDHNWLQISLTGESSNTFAFGTQVTAWDRGERWFVEQMPIRGFQSTVDHRLHLGLGDTEILDSLVVYWPTDKRTVLRDVETNQLLELREEDTNETCSQIEINGEQQPGEKLLNDITDEFDLEWRHNENDYSDFERDRLLFHMRSTEGPALCVEDINGDGLDDFYLGGARGQAGNLFVQNSQSQFEKITLDLLEQDASSEDTDCAIFDANGNGNMDLYVTSGSNEYSSSSSSLRDRLYFNKGDLQFERSEQPLPGLSYEVTSTVEPADFDNDGDTDLFVGVRLRPFAVGYPVRGYLLENDGNGQFKDVTEEVSPDLLEMGMITDADWGDISGNGYPDLVVVGEWMPLTYFANEEEKLQNKNMDTGLDSTNGWWRSVHIDDLDRDGNLDILAGNYGLNSRFEASKEEPIEMWTGDFNQNGSIEQIVTTYKNGKRYPMALRHDLIEEIPSLENKFPTYESFAGKNMGEIFSKEQLDEAHYSKAYLMDSVIGWNLGDDDGAFTIESLPFRAQLSVLYDVSAIDLNKNGVPELISGGNLREVKPEIGNYAASYGSVFKMDKERTYKNLNGSNSGFDINGQVRAIKHLKLNDGREIIMVARNNESLKIFEIETFNK